LVEVKGVRCLIEAMPEVLRQVPDARLLVLGEGALYDELQASVRSHGLQEQVRLMGHVAHEQVPGYLAMCDWLVAPSVVDATGRTEGLGLALLEAFASGRPAIASRVGGIPDVLQDGVNGYLARPGDAASLARQIVRAIRESDWESFSAAARRMAEQYDQVRVARLYAQTFDALAGRKG
jgi:glycosyltransferase involved in cell wall biosynthesis